MKQTNLTLYTRSCVEDMHQILDHLHQMETAVPGLAGRMDIGKVAAVGHSFGIPHEFVAPCSYFLV